MFKKNKKQNYYISYNFTKKEGKEIKGGFGGIGILSKTNIITEKVITTWSDAIKKKHNLNTVAIINWKELKKESKLRKFIKKVLFRNV